MINILRKLKLLLYFWPLFVSSHISLHQIKTPRTMKSFTLAIIVLVSTVIAAPSAYAFPPHAAPLADALANSLPRQDEQKLIKRDLPAQCLSIACPSQSLCLPLILL